MSFTSYDKIIEALAGTKGQHIFAHKVSITAVAGQMYRLWAAVGFPGAGSDPVDLAGAACTKDTAGAIPFTNATGPATLHLLSLGAGGERTQTLMLYDRLLHAGAINLNTTDAQSFTGTTAPSRYTSGVGVLLLVEITGATGSTARTLSVSYTNTASASGRTATVAIPASTPVDRCYLLGLQAGDTGVKSIEGASMSGAMGGGTANIVMVAPTIITVPYLTCQWSERDLVLQTANLPRVYDDACLAMMVIATTTTTGLVNARLVMAEG